VNVQRCCHDEADSRVAIQIGTSMTSPRSVLCGNDMDGAQRSSAESAPGVLAAVVLILRATLNRYISEGETDSQLSAKEWQ
jgi:hypothetical protein